MVYLYSEVKKEQRENGTGARIWLPYLITELSVVVWYGLEME